MIRKTLLAAMLASSLGSFAVPGISADYGYRHAPPAPRYEVVPPPRHGYVWAPGHWAPRGGGYVWIEGRWRAR